jgi:hypothetical protein
MPPTDPHPESDAQPIIDLDTAPPSREFLALVTFEFAWRHRFCAVSIDHTHDLLVITDDTPPSVVARISERMPRECQLLQTTDEQVCRLIARAYEKPRPS